MSQQQKLSAKNNNNRVTWLLAIWYLAFFMLLAAIGWSLVRHVRSLISAEPVAWLSADALPSSYPDPICEMCGAVLDGSSGVCRCGEIVAAASN